MRLQADIQNSINHGQYTAGVFLDFSKAYDMIWKDGLMHKVRNLNITNNMYNFIKDFLSKRTIQVKVGDDLSDTVELENGTPQGSVLSPLLFLIMINDFPTTENKVKMQYLQMIVPYGNRETTYIQLSQRCKRN
jgi:hypothetical protein